MELVRSMKPAELLILIFVIVDDFIKLIKQKNSKLFALSKTKTGRKPKLSISEAITLSIFFYLSGHKNLKVYYFYIKNHFDGYFNLPSYKNFVTVINKTIGCQLYMLCVILIENIFYSDEFIVDSFPLKVCENKRIKSSKLCRGLAKVGKGTGGWFYGFKVHLVCNGKGEILNVKFTPGNTHDLKPGEGYA